MRPENTPSHTHAFMANTGAATSAEPSPATSPGKMTFGKFPGAGIITGLYSKSSGTSATDSLNSGFLGTALIPQHQCDPSFESDGFIEHQLHHLPGRPVPDSPPVTFITQSGTTDHGCIYR